MSKLDYSPLILFMMPETHLKYLIPDYELTSCRLIFESTLCHESFFGLGRLYAYEGKFFKASEYLTKAVSCSTDTFYELWNALIKVKTGENNEKALEKISFFQQFWCCGIMKRTDNLVNKLKNLGGVEGYWGLLELALKSVDEVDKPEFYATQIKALDEYCGYLAWAEVFLRKNDNENFLSLIGQLIKRYGLRPEAYVKQWNFAYYTIKDYNFAEDIANEALLRLNPNTSFNYYILFCIYTAKVYFHQKRYKECLGFLQKKFLEYPTYPIFLYLFGKYSTKSEDFRYNGAALSALQESLRLCDSSRLGNIYYWLAKSFMLARLHIDAYQNALLGLKILEKREVKKNSELSAFIKELKPSMDKIETVEKMLSDNIDLIGLEKCKELCREIQNFHKLTADILYARCLWKCGRNEEALKKLYSVSGVSTVKMTAYFVLLDFLKQRENLKSMKSVASEMIQKCRNSQVPSYIWMKVNIMYSKVLVKLRKPGKAILLLKSLAKLLPPFPFVDIHYTKALQRASSIHELTNAHEKIISSFNAYSFANYKNSFIDSFADCRNFSKKLIEEDEQGEISPKKYIQRRGNRLATEKLDGCFYQKKVSFDVKEEKNNKGLGLPEIKVTDNNEIMMFSICSETKFLYYIAKIAMRYNVCINDGIFAVSDYLELLKFEKSKESAEKNRQKALRLYTFLLEQVKNTNN